MTNYGSSRYLEFVIKPQIRSDILVTPVVQMLAKKEAQNQLKFDIETRIADIGGGSGGVINFLLNEVEDLKKAELVEPSSVSIVNAKNQNFSLGLERMRRGMQPKNLLCHNQTAMEYLATKPDNTFGLLVLCMVTLHFDPQELVTTMTLLANKTKPGGALIIADLHSSRFDVKNQGMKKNIILPTTEPDLDFELDYYPRPFEEITDSLIRNGFELKTNVIPRLNSIISTNHLSNHTEITPHDHGIYPRILDNLKPNDTPYQISLLRKNL
jgi:ubiquinone/menaquinone biosynthesis C-methylase UbiE